MRLESWQRPGVNLKKKFLHNLFLSSPLSKILSGFRYKDPDTQISDDPGDEQTLFAC